MAQEFKVKGLDRLDLPAGSMKQFEVDGIPDGKVLIVHAQGGTYHATSSICTHFGAPLEKGVLSPMGQIICPWHGACFNLSTGDVEDAPAPDPLAKYEVFEKAGAVYVRGAEDVIKANRRTGQIKCAAAGAEKIVVVGGGSGAFGFIEALRGHGSKDSVTLISNEGYLPLDRTKLSKALITDPNKLALRPQSWYDDASVTTVQDEVTAVDFVHKHVATASGKTYPYTKLILATGGTAKRLPMPGFKELKNIFVLRNAHDVQGIMAAVGEKKGKNIVVVGSSFIGMEAGNALASGNNVTIVGQESQPLENVMGAEVGAVFRKNLEKNNVHFKMSAGVEKALPSSSDSSVVGSVHLADGTELPADLVVLGVGVAPATTFLQQAPGLPEGVRQKDGSLRTGADFAIAGLDGVYAIGDIATYDYTGPGTNGKAEPVRIEHWDVAQNAGRRVGARLANATDPAATGPFIPVFWSALGAQLRYCGHPIGKPEDTVIMGTPDQGKFAAYYTRGDEVHAVATMGMDPVVAKCIDLMRRGKMPGKKEIQGGMDVLAIA